jgi:hypothetical protein
LAGRPAPPLIQVRETRAGLIALRRSCAEGFGAVVRDLPARALARGRLPRPRPTTPQRYLVRCPALRRPRCGRLHEHLVRGVRGPPPPSRITRRGNVPSLAHPEASPPCGRRARAGAARLAAWSSSTVGAPRPGARWEGERGGDVVPVARSGEPRRALWRLHHAPRACRSPGDDGCVADLLAPVHPVHVPIPRCERASAGHSGPTGSRPSLHSGPPPPAGQAREAHSSPSPSPAAASPLMLDCPRPSPGHPERTRL